MNAADINGRAVISVATGARLGRVDEVLLDRTSLALAAFRVTAAGQQALIPFAQVQSLGSDAVMVPGDDVAQWVTTSSAAEGLVSVGALVTVQPPCGAGSRDGGGMPRIKASPAATRNSSSRRPC